MCTLTWIRGARSYELYFSRDEKRTRGPALPPALHARGGVRYLAPTDTDGGGTWVGVNEHGLSVCLLNGYRAADLHAGEWRSRGLFVAELLAARGLAGLRARLAAEDLARYRSFSIVAFDLDDSPLSAEYDGTLALRALEDSDRPRSSSSLDPLGATRMRRWVYEGMIAGHTIDAALLERFHASHEPERGPLSPCMHRADAETVSFTRVRADPARVELRYAAGAPCGGGALTTLVLERSRELRRGAAAGT